MKLTENKIKSEMLYNGKIIRLFKDEVELENGKSALREVVEHDGGVGIIAVTDDDYVLMVRQFRYPQNKILLEIPAGKLEKGEDPYVCGMRELEEETGYTAEKLVDIGYILPTPAYNTEKTYIYMAKELKPGKQKLDADEFLEVEKIPFNKAVQMAACGEITDAKTCAALLKVYYLKNKDK